jgi:hypothetical protein
MMDPLSDPTSFPTLTNFARLVTMLHVAVVVGLVTVTERLLPPDNSEKLHARSVAEISQAEKLC